MGVGGSGGVGAQSVFDSNFNEVCVCRSGCVCMGMCGRGRGCKCGWGCGCGYEECITHRGVYHTQGSVSHTGRCVRVHRALVGARRATALVGGMRTYIHSYILTLTLTLPLTLPLTLTLTLIMTLDLTLTGVVIRDGDLHTCAYSTGGCGGVHTYITGEVHAYVHIGGIHTALVACIHDGGVHTY